MALSTPILFRFGTFVVIIDVLPYWLHTYWLPVTLTDWLTDWLIDLTSKWATRILSAVSIWVLLDWKRRVRNEYFSSLFCRRLSRKNIDYSENYNLKNICTDTQREINFQREKSSWGERTNRLRDTKDFELTI